MYEKTFMFILFFPFFLRSFLETKENKSQNLLFFSYIDIHIHVRNDIKKKIGKKKKEKLFSKLIEYIKLYYVSTRTKTRMHK
jgi:hypothetical protein